MKSFARILALFLGAGLILLLGILLSVRVYLATPHFRNFVLSKINPMISGHIGIDGHRLSLLSGTLELSGGTLAGPAGDKPLRFERLSMRLKWAALLRRKIDLYQIVLEKPQVTLTQTSNGELTLQAALRLEDAEPARDTAADAASPPIDLEIRKFKMTSGQLVYTDRGMPIDVVINDMDGDLSLNLIPRSARLKLETGKIHVKTKTIDTVFEGVRLAAALENERLKISDLGVRYNSSSLQLSGSLDAVFQKPGMAAVALKADCSLADLQALTGLTTAMTGRAEIRLTANGPVENPQAELFLSYGGGQVGDYKIAGAELKIDLEDRYVTVQHLDLNTGAGRLSAAGTLDAQQALPNGLLPFRPQTDLLAYDFSLSGSQIDVAAFVSDFTPLNGSANGRIDLSGRGIDYRRLSASLTGDIAIEKLASTALTAPIDFGLSFESSIAQGNVLVDQLLLRTSRPAAYLTMSGSAALEDRSLNARFDFNAPDISGLLELAGIEGAQGAVRLHGDVAGKIDQPLVNLTLQGDRLGYGALAPGNVGCVARLDPNGWLNVSQLEITHQEATVQGQGRLHVFNGAWQLAPRMPVFFDLSFADIKPEVFWSQLPGAGRFDGRLRVTGSIQQPEAEFSLQGRECMALGRPLGDAELRGRFAGGGLEVEKLVISKGATDLRFAGKMQLLDPGAYRMLPDPEFELKVFGRGIEVTEFSNQARGTIGLQAHLTGTMADPSGTLTVRADTLVIEEQAFDSVDLDIEIGDRKVSLTPLRIRAEEGGEITATGWIAFDRTFDLVVGSDRWALAQIGLLKKLGQVAGELRFNMTAQGSLTAPIIAGDFQVAHLALNQQPFEDISLQVEVRDQRVRLKASQAFDLDAAYDLDSGDFTVDAVLDQAQLEPYWAVAGRADLSGMTTGTFRAQGNTKHLKDVTAQIDLTRLDLFYERQKLISTGGLKAELKDRRFVLAQTNLFLLEQGRIAIGGQGAFDGSIDLVVEGVVPLKAVDAFITEVDDLGGQIMVQAKIAGKTVQPAIDARITLDNLAGTLPVLLQRVHSLNGKIQLDGAQVTLADINGKIDRGRFDLSGTIGLKGWQPQRADLILNTDQLPFELPAVMNLKTTSRLKFHGDREKAFAEGEIVVLEGLYYKDVDLNPLKGFTEKKREKPMRAEKIDIPYFGETILNVAVKRRQPFVVDNNLAYLEISPDLRLEGTPNNPVLSGRAQVDSGEIYYAGNTFVVKRGIVDFLNPYKIEPTLDIHSEVTVRHWLITLLVSGPPDDLKIDLSSEPPEQNADILSLLVAGKTGAELRGGTGTSSMSAKQMMAQLVASTFGEDIKKVTGVDLLEVETAGDQTTGSDLIKVTVGKKLSERMIVKYAVSAKQGETIQRAISEYHFMDNFLISGFQETKGVYGGELVFRIEFR